MTERLMPHPARLTDRWPTALAIIFGSGAITVIALVGREAALFGPAVATMAGIYLMAYAVGRPWTAWPAFLVLSAVVSVLHVVWQSRLLPLDPATGMAFVLVPLWLWAVARRRFTDVATFSIQTGGAVGFGGLTLLCAAAQPQLGAVLAGIGFLTHGVWDAYHFRVGKVVSRPWSEFCAVVDLVVGTALIVAAAAG
ncbi:hypothetical protein [Micromonospora sp. NPDC000018]|uniref:hypothetical protein n=1 Tax=Micromonospora sp. NPDC000018 TaxID=3154239 RepID=UPI00331A24DE